MSAGVCTNLVRYPGCDMAPGMDLHDFNDTDRSQCMDACIHSDEECGAAVFNNVLQQCYTKKVGAQRVPILNDEEKKKRLEVIECKGEKTL